MLIQELFLEDITYSNFENKELKEKLKYFRDKNFDEIVKDVFLITIQGIKNEYNYNFSKKDIEILNDFLNQTSLDISNQEAFYPFLVLTILKDFKKEQIHCLFETNSKAKIAFDKAAKLYNSLNIGASVFWGMNVNEELKKRLYQNNIIYTNWQNIGFDKIENQQIEKFSDKLNLKFEQAFIFDIDRIIYDFEKFHLKLQLESLKTKNLAVKDIFKNYNNIVGVSPSLFFENKKIEKNYNIKTKTNNENSSQIIEKLKNTNDVYSKTQEEKIRLLSRHIETLSKEIETIIVDVDNKQDLKLLKSYLDLKNIKYNLIEHDYQSEELIAQSILTPNNITIFTNLLSATIKSELGGNCKEIAKYNTLQINNNEKSNFFKEKYKKELIKQEENKSSNIKLINDKNGVNILFASHYIELKHEYLILENYKHIPIKNITFYNCPQDDIYQELKLNNLTIFDKKNDKENEFIFKIVKKFVFWLRKYSINKLFIQEKSYITYSPQKQVAKEKTQRNQPCPCGSGKKYKNCCGR